MSKFKTLLGCSFFFMTVLTHAQTLLVSENARVKANISSLDITRIAVFGDRIRVLRGIEGAYSYSNDAVSGAVFLKPRDEYKNRPFYVFISTEQGHNYLLELNPTSTLSAGMLILKLKPSLTSAFKKELDSEWSTDPPESSPDVPNWQALIQRMVKHTPQPNEKVIQVQAKPVFIRARLLSSDPLITKPCQIKLTFQTQYVNSGLIGQIYTVENPNTYPAHLTESLFYRAGDRAIFLKNTLLPAGGKTELYKVQESRNHV